MYSVKRSIIFKYTFFGSRHIYTLSSKLFVSLDFFISFFSPRNIVVFGFIFFLLCFRLSLFVFRFHFAQHDLLCCDDIIVGILFSFLLKFHDCLMHHSQKQQLSANMVDFDKLPSHRQPNTAYSQIQHTAWKLFWHPLASLRYKSFIKHLEKSLVTLFCDINT